MDDKPNELSLLFDMLIGLILFFAIFAISAFVLKIENKNLEFFDLFFDSEDNAAIIGALLVIYASPVYIILMIIHYLVNNQLKQIFIDNYLRFTRIFNGVFFVINLAPMLLGSGLLLFFSAYVYSKKAINFIKTGKWDKNDPFIHEKRKPAFESIGKMAGVLLFLSLENGLIGDLGRSAVLYLLYAIPIALIIHIFVFIIANRSFKLTGRAPAD